ncbi:MAG: glycosyltransferase [Deltaproteobacteria bacterium]|nr:glycosyltransferase [Deltaproteobacteria bacterium]MBW2076208.1 glycosyltransferase [Deltaproteobacteria bacterium]MBW2309739.1 glycosyltransferase [Deltaproteobacteria bacterium]
MIKILVGIPVLDNIEMTRACMQSLYQYTDSDRMDLHVSVVIIDNGSKEDIAGLIKGEFVEARFPTYYVRNPTNLGVAIAWNQIIRFSPDTITDSSLCYDYYVISNNDVLFGQDWLQPMVEVMEGDELIGWLASLENGSPVMEELLEAHSNTKRYRVNPNRPYSSENILESVKRVYEKWGGHESFCKLVKDSDLPPFIKRMRSAVCFMIRPAMIRQIGLFDEDYPPVGIAEDLEYFLRIEGVIKPPWITDDYPAKGKWKYGLCGGSVIHHNWCMTRQGPGFDGRRWDKEKEKNWKTKFGRSKKYYTKKYLA